MVCFLTLWEWQQEECLKPETTHLYSDDNNVEEDGEEIDGVHLKAPPIGCSQSAKHVAG